METFIDHHEDPSPFSHIIIASPVNPRILNIISEYSQRTHTPVFYIHCVGFYAHFSIYLPPTFPIVDTHPDPESISDLRLLKPWPELVQFAAEQTQNLDNMNDHDHGHISYVLLLLYYLEVWKASHEGKVPTAYKDKNAFRELVRSGMRTNIPEQSEENYEEAIAAVLKNLNEPTPSSAVRDVLNAPECQHLSSTSANFWVIANSISRFYEKHGVLPVPGSVPDMKAQSADYIKLQNVYKTKARADVHEVLSTVRTLESSLGRTNLVDAAEVEAFCKNAAYIKLVRGRPFHIVAPDRKLAWGERAKAARAALTDDTSLILLYIAFLAWDEFCAAQAVGAQHAAPTPPGLMDVVGDAEKLTGIAHRIIANLVAESGMPFDEEDELDEVKVKAGEICQELARAGGAELHNIAALAGGLVAQEVIKVITKQYIPVDNTCLFDGIKSVSSVLRL